MKFNQPSNSGGLALDKLAGRGNNAEGAKKRVEKLRNHELNKKHKLKKLKKRLDGTSQQHAKQAPRDNVAELEEILGMSQQEPADTAPKPGSKLPPSHNDHQAQTTRKQPGKHGKRDREQQATGEPGVPEVLHGVQLGDAGKQAAARHEEESPAEPQQMKQSAGQRQRQQSAPPSKPVPRMQRLMAEAAQRKAEAHAAREAALQARAEKQARTEAAQKLRTQQKKRFFKRNRAGQPLMQYRIEKMLKQLENEQKGA